MGYKSLSINLGFGIFVMLLWLFVICPELKNTNDLLELTAENTGFIQIADNLGDPLSEPIKMKFFWTKKITEDNGDDVVIHTVYDYRDVNTDESFWTVELDELVDKKTKKYLEKPGYFAFPTNLEKKNYDVYDVGGSIMHYTFEGVDELDGLMVYKFSGTTTFDISSEYPDFDQEILEDYTATNFIEPVTGIDVSFNEKFMDYAIIDDKKVPILDAWDESTEFSKSVLIKKTKDLIILYSIYNTIIPLFIIMFIFTITLTVELILKLRKNLILEHQHQLKNERLVTIGELAARIAHDIRNPLNVIKNSYETLKFIKNDPIKFENNLERTERAIYRITHQVEGIMDFVRDSPLEKEKCSLIKIIESAIMGIQVNEKVKIILPTKDIFVYGDKIKLESLFYNLITNSIQSMKNQGTITIRSAESNETISIDVEDQGTPISAEIRQKIFEPLFTTKQTGTGLGLVSCKKIVEQHGGTISIKNNPVTFTITLPVIDEKFE
jgi:signal transduction histidine kinase